MKNTVLSFKEAKRSRQKLTILTAYEYSMAKIMDEAGIHCILVGDSVGMVSLGYKNTLSVSMEEMLHHSRAVSRGVKNALLVTDMPFMSYQTSVRDAVSNAGRIIKEGRAEAVKLEGGAALAPQIRAIVRASIPVMAHIGLTPQSINAFGGFKVQGVSEEAAQALVNDAKAVEEAGAFAVVLECIPASLAGFITKSIDIPTIGIGAGSACDGQVLVCHDMLGMFSDFIPKFTKQYANLTPVLRSAFADYITEVGTKVFPAPEHCFNMDDSIIDRLY